MKPLFACASAGLLAALAAGCAPTIRLSTPEPVKIDVNMKVDITTQDGGPKVSGTAVSPDSLTPQERRRNRMAEVQALKNDRLVGEGADGLLAVRELPADPAYSAYVQRVVSEENADRELVFQQQAAEEKKPATVVAKEAAANAREASFPGEWYRQEDGAWVRR